MAEQPAAPALDAPPDAVRQDLAGLAAALDTRLPHKWTDRNLLIATWNIRAFSDLTEKWLAGDHDSPKRDLAALRAIAEIVSRFDVVAVQEVKGTLKALRHMMKWLGPNWGFLMTDVTQGSAGNSERLAYVFDRRRLILSGLAAEIVVPDEWLGPDTDIQDGYALERQFARTPYAVSFRAASHTFILVTTHITYGQGAEDRVDELAGIARWMRDWAERSNAWHHDLILMGDFNIDRRGDALWQAFTSTGLTVPPSLNDAPRSVFDAGDGGGGKFYDQIAWFADRDAAGNGVPLLSMQVAGAGYFDFLPYVYRTSQPGLTTRDISFRISDHFPLWVEFRLPH